jgi:hypothetical protein
LKTVAAECSLEKATASDDDGLQSFPSLAQLVELEASMPDSIGKQRLFAELIDGFERIIRSAGSA